MTKITSYDIISAVFEIEARKKNRKINEERRAALEKDCDMIDLAVERLGGTSLSADITDEGDIISVLVCEDDSKAEHKDLAAVFRYAKDFHLDSRIEIRFTFPSIFEETETGKDNI